MPAEAGFFELMSKNLVIVESPAKAKTIKKYLGKDFDVLASYGHVRDLLPKEGAVDPARDFAMKYRVIEKNARHVDAIAKALKKADALYLATDPDREGEAISWHLLEILKNRKLLKDKKVGRVVFHEITKRAIEEAIQHPREISQDLVDAQQARRALDYLVGFNLSPLLWKKIRRGLSAGRVQSPARFQSREYCPVQYHRRKTGPGGGTDARAGSRWQAAGGQGGKEAAPAQPGGPLHHLHAATGGRPQTGFHRSADHAHRPATL